LHVIKPHGCVKKLAKGQAVFVVTADELKALPVKLNSVNGRLKVVFSDSPLTTIGWSAEEIYIHDEIGAVRHQHGMQQMPLTQISMEFGKLGFAGWLIPD